MNVKIKASLERFDKLMVEVEAGEEKLDKRMVELMAAFETLQVEKKSAFLIRLGDVSMRFGSMADTAIGGLQPPSA
jgi:N-acetylmuramic acid 6-phosphate (MurNAc-6-P) etherase